MKIPVKVIFICLASVLTIFFLTNTWGKRAAERAVLTSIETEYLEKAQLLAREYVERTYTMEMSAEEVNRQLQLIDGMIGARIWIINSKRVVVTDTRGISGLHLDYISDRFSLMTINENVVIPGIIYESSLEVSAPIIYDYSEKGYVCLFVPMSLVERRVLPFMNAVNLGLLVLTGIIAVTALAIYMISAMPVRKIRNAVLEVAKGNYNYNLKLRRNDEFKDLSDALKFMVDRIRNVDDYQKKFIANISHDFRSPLTSIKGYAEAIKDGTIPTESQNKYLDIILFETDRLTKLTTNLLDLNRIDDKGLMLDITTFEINGIIKQTAAAFEGICTQKRIVIDLSFAAWETNVEADMSRIQQVIYNLTDNAIKFSNPGSVVEIETEEKGSKLLVRVRDHGVGIAKENIKKIWDRFYKTDTSRGKDKKGTGLGLSIVKEVITAHGENINVISTEGVGTEFTFTLPLAGEN